MAFAMVSNVPPFKVGGSCLIYSVCCSRQTRVLDPTIKVQQWTVQRKNWETLMPD